MTWRELGHNFAAHRDDIDRYESLPSWAQATLAHHAGDPRPWCYELEALTQARTHDPLWNAAQTELVESGVMHNYLRMLWGKLVLQWSATPREALASLVELNNRWALDGRDPNSYSGILWIFGRYDRPWGPERPVFGTVRCMTSDSARRKLDLTRYLARWGAQRSLVPAGVEQPSRAQSCAPCRSSRTKPSRSKRRTQPLQRAVACSWRMRLRDSE
ncbi:MAG: hypothetical protein U0168_18430 [Nannocystaceae bacterium]